MDSLGAHAEKLEGDAGGPLLVLHLAKGGVGANAIRVQRQPGHKPDLQVRLALACDNISAEPSINGSR